MKFVLWIYRTGKICCFVVLWFYLPIILQAPPSQQTLLCWNCQVPVCSTIIVHTRHILWETWSNYLLFHIPYLISTFLSVIEITIFNIILYSFFWHYNLCIFAKWFWYRRINRETYSLKWKLYFWPRISDHLVIHMTYFFTNTCSNPTQKIQQRYKLALGYLILTKKLSNRGNIFFLIFCILST